MRNRLLLLFLFNIYFNSNAQEIPINPNAYDSDSSKTGTWTILYDKDSNITDIIDSVEFYRIIKYIKGVPSGKVLNYYSNGKIKWEGYLLSDNPIIKDSICIWYNEGIQEYTINYKNNIPHGDYVLFNTRGEECFRIKYINGNPDIHSFNISKSDTCIIDYLDFLSSRFQQYGYINKSLELKNHIMDIVLEYLGKDNTNYIDITNDLGILYSKMSRHSEALKMKLESLKFYELLSDTSSYNYGITLDNLAITYCNLNNYNKAYKYQLKAINLIENGLGKDHRSYYIVMNNLAYTCHKIALDYLEDDSLFNFYNNLSISYYNSCINLVNKPSIDYALVLDNISVVYASSGNDSLALVTCKQAVDIYKDSLGVKHKDYGIALSNLARRYEDLGRDMKALELQEELMSINKLVYGEDGLANIQNLNNIAYTYFKLEKFDQSFESFLQLNKIYKNQYLEFEKSLNSKLLDKAYNNLVQTLHHIFYILYDVETNVKSNVKSVFEHYSPEQFLIYNQKYSKNIYDCFIFTKGRELSNLNSIGSYIYESSNENLINLYDDWLSYHQTLSYCYEISIDDRKSFGLNIEALSDTINNIERDLINLSGVFNNINREYSFKNIENNLTENEIYIDFLNNYGDNYYAYITKKGYEFPKLIYLGSVSNLDSIYSYYSTYTTERPFQKNFSYQDKIYGDICYKYFWGKFQQDLDGISTVYFSPEGVYSKINPNVLYDSTSSSFLIDKYDIKYVSNVEDFVHQKENIQFYDRSDSLHAVLIGNPTFLLENKELILANNGNHSRAITKDKLDTLQRGMLLSDLPGTQTELDLISNNLKSKGWHVDVISGTDATESRVKKIESPKILHIATHGFFFKDLKMEIPLKMISENNKNAITNPMTRSGLIFSGAENTINGEILGDNNGWLNSYEASLLNLRGTELVVLSACQTGAGDVQNGKGVYGLQRAIRLAGAESIIMSMWDVDDNATQELMTYFYDYWIDKKMTKKDAFKKAQQKIRDIYKHPYYWGAFIMLGK